MFFVLRVFLLTGTVDNYFVLLALGELGRRGAVLLFSGEGRAKFALTFNVDEVRLVSLEHPRF